ncbi:hypothetical protein FP2506_01465 [Fulvimarina pelagi HTCC2506]|uniref:Uncharacterized protein n=1 Tax=Fulvimarina pelagi HTCC2506 TaxID=314231 RepID=Q0G204_9HYPH|nr:hypothetical protein [Fulvimarina pelagi]EAU41394.1 hypothetical protein FP2506_01465 [Fulvimarina pelagi HTCC2506]
MIRKTVLALAAAATLATAAAPANASDYGAEVPPSGYSHSSNRDAVIAGAVIGLAVGIIGAGLAKKRHRNCFDKPIRKWSRYHGRKVVVGYRTICR